MRQAYLLGSMVIANGQTESSIIGSKTLHSATAFVIHGPSALTGTVHVEVAQAHDDDGTNMIDLYIGTTQVVVTAARAVYYEVAGFLSMRAISSSAEGAARTIPVWVITDVA